MRRLLALLVLGALLSLPHVTRGSIDVEPVRPPSGSKHAYVSDPQDEDDYQSTNGAEEASTSFSQQETVVDDASLQESTGDASFVQETDATEESAYAPSTSSSSPSIASPMHYSRPPFKRARREEPIPMSLSDLRRAIEHLAYEIDVLEEELESLQSYMEPKIKELKTKSALNMKLHGHLKAAKQDTIQTGEEMVAVTAAALSANVQVVEKERRREAMHRQVEANTLMAQDLACRKVSAQAERTKQFQRLNLQMVVWRDIVHAFKRRVMVLKGLEAVLVVGGAALFAFGGPQEALITKSLQQMDDAPSDSWRAWLFGHASKATSTPFFVAGRCVADQLGLVEAEALFAMSTEHLMQVMTRLRVLTEQYPSLAQQVRQEMLNDAKTLTTWLDASSDHQITFLNVQEAARNMVDANQRHLRQPVDVSALLRQRLDHNFTTHTTW